MLPKGIKWLQAVQTVVAFMQIPTPIYSNKGEQQRGVAASGGMGAVPHLTSIDSNLVSCAEDVLISLI